MDFNKNINQKQNYDGSIGKNQKDEEYKINNQSQKIKNSGSNYRLKSNNLNQRAHSRSRSPFRSSNQWISSNAFINFVQDFRQNFAGVRSTKIFQMAGERWKKMSSEEKQPYIKAAMNIKNKKQNQQEIENVNNVINTNAEQPKNENAQKQEKPKKEKKKGEANKSTRDKSNTESDNESIFSDTTATNTSEDISDMSS
ncbi:hypothetical protein QLX08_003866 [Tetragonisca angustula]|uniref:HMG box domain-containing protein n=1 Tax=Tetragonisca angustula TaxID=166442 RepID=A0AAW1A752_9HYME